MAQTPYYAGKTVTIVAGTKAGDVYDTYARLFAQHMPKYIPGNPYIVAKHARGRIDDRRQPLYTRSRHPTA